jgi:hypothetical protein
MEKQGKNKTAKVRLPFDAGQKPMPYRGRKPAGSVILVDGKPELIVFAPDTGYRGYTEGYIRVPDRRMEPARKQGELMGIMRMKPGHVLYWEYEYFIVDRTLHGVLCRIHPSMKKSDSITLKFDNKQYRPRMPEFSRLQGLFIVEPLQGWPEE